MAKEKEIKLVFSSEKYEELKAKIADLTHERDSLREMIEKWDETHKTKITELDADNTTLIQERNDALKTIADLTRTNSALEVLVDVKIAELKTLEAKDKGRMEEIAELDLEIAELEEKLRGLALTLSNCNSTHWDNRKACAVELQAWNSSGALDPIIRKLEGRNEE